MGKKEERNRLKKKLGEFKPTKQHLHDICCELDTFLGDSIEMYLIGTDYVKYLTTDGHNIAIAVTERDITVL